MDAYAADLNWRKGLVFKCPQKIGESSVSLHCITVICFRTILLTALRKYTGRCSDDFLAKPLSIGLLISKSTCYCSQAYQFEYILRFCRTKKCHQCTFYPYSHYKRIWDSERRMYFWKCSPVLNVSNAGRQHYVLLANLCVACSGARTHSDTIRNIHFYWMIIIWQISLIQCEIVKKHDKNTYNRWSDYIFCGGKHRCHTRHIRDTQRMRLSNKLNVSKTFNRMLGHPARPKNKATNIFFFFFYCFFFSSVSEMSSSSSSFMSMVLTKEKKWNKMLPHSSYHRLFEFPSRFVVSFFCITSLFERIRVSLRFH